MYDSLECSVKKWPILVQIINEDSGGLDDSIKSKIINVSIKKMQRARLKPISIALDQYRSSQYC